MIGLKTSFICNQNRNHKIKQMENDDDLTHIDIKELDFDIIPPSSTTMFKEGQGGCKIAVLGKGGTGKTKAILSLLYAKKNIYPIAMVQSSTAHVSGDFKEIPELFRYDEYDEDAIQRFIERQKLAREHLADYIPWNVLILDDVLKDKKVFNSSEVQGDLMKMGRHYKMMYIVSAQNPVDIPSSIRNNFDGVLILREPQESVREFIWKHYASIIPRQYFNAIMNQITDDRTGLYINNATTSMNWKESVFWWKPTLVPEGWKFGCKEYWQFHNERFEPNYARMY
jgi:hypothetical protein